MRRVAVTPLPLLVSNQQMFTKPHLRQTFRLLAALRALVDLAAVYDKVAIVRAAPCISSCKLAALTGRGQWQRIACNTAVSA
jgi:hypothetical protein